MSDLTPDLKIEWAYPGLLHAERLPERGSGALVPVVRLDAVDQLIEQAVRFAKYVRANSPLECAVHVEAARFVDFSATVAAWRGRQKKEEP